MTRRGSRDGIRTMAFAVLAAALAPLAAQDTRTSPASAPQYTLHAYANLVQIPVLVLSTTRDRLWQTIPPNRFAVSIDSGPWFRPTHVRPEGDDAISLSILLDVHGDSAGLLSHIADQLAALFPERLHPNDHVTIYSLDCGLVRSANDLPVDPAILRSGTEAALRPWKTRTSTHTRCSNTVHLQQVLLHIENTMQDLPGRRVILIVSEGEDELGKPSWRDVGEAAQNAATAIFAIAPQGLQFQPVRGLSLAGSQKANLLNMACEMSGGTLVAIGSSELATTLKNFTRMLRERYIVDFPRPANSTPGRHSLQIRIDKTAAFIRPAGISVPIPDPAILTDPTTVPSDSSLTPVQGKRSEPPH